MSDCNCNQTTPPPAATTPANCNPIPAYVETAILEPCCMACVFDDMVANWVKPVGEATGLLPVCDVTRFRQGQCVTVLGTNGLGGTYHVEAVLTDSIEVSIHDGDTYDVGGAGTVQGGRIYLLPTCPLTQAELISVISSAIPSEFVLAIGATSDTNHGYSLALDGDGKIILVYSQVNFEAQVISYLQTLGVTLFKPVTNTTWVMLFDSEAAASGTLDIATDFAVTIPPNATHVRLLVDFFVMAGHDNGAATPGDCSQMIGSLEFAGSSQFQLNRASESIYPAVQSIEGASLRDNGSRAEVAIDIPMTAGMVAWEYTRTLYHAIGSSDAGNDAEGSVRLLGFLITP